MQELEQSAPVAEQEDRTDRFLRQKGILPTALLEKQSITIVGVGAVGRQLAMQLAALGVPAVTLIDHDSVELINVTTQGYEPTDIGRPKVEACAESMRKVDPNLKVKTHMAKYAPDLVDTDVVFCCVDGIETRQQIWSNEKSRSAFWADARMLGETIRVLAASDEEERDYYDRTLFTSAEAERGACTQRGLIYTACISAGLLTQQYTKWLRKFPVDTDVIFSLTSMDLMHHREPIK